jgi:hypothetical protein
VLRSIFIALAGAALVVGGLVLSTAQPAWANHGNITGSVTDSTTGAPLDNVCVTLGPPIRCWTSTNALGQYTVDLSGFGTDGQTWDLYFLRTGYTTQSKTVVVNGPTAQNVLLVSTNPGQPAPSATPVPGTVQPAPPPSPTGQTYTVYLPNIVKTLGGATGWHTPFIVQNVGTAFTYLTVRYYNFSDGALVLTRNATVLPGRSFVDSPRDAADLPGNSQFSVVITSQGAPVVAVVNQHQGPGAGNEALSYSGISAGSANVSLPLVSNLVSGWLTTLIMQNVGVATTTVTASFVSLDGTKTATLTRSIAPGRSAFIDPRFEASLTQGHEYSVTMTAPNPIAVVANNHNDLPGTAAPMGDSYNGVAAALGSAYLPYIAKNTDGVGRTSRVVIQNAGADAATPTVTLTPLGGGTATTVTAPSIAAGRAWAFTPTAADGEYSLTIGGGTFAAVAATTSPATAMYYTSTSSAKDKLYMPNVTRRLTQNPSADPGWNTPILLQSVSANTATLKWYSFATGSLVTTQTVALTPGAAIRVDPATVPGLSDNNQYSVVYESTGTAVAIVTQLNLIAGDNAMIYKGFETPSATP